MSLNADIRNILYASDLDEGCETALACAISFANRLGAQLRVLTVIDEQRERSLVEIDSHVPQSMLDQYHDDRAQRALAYIQSQVAAFYAVRPDEVPQNPITELIVREGDDVPKAILDEAERSGADLIVMTSDGKGLLASLLFGGAAQQVLRRTRKPLLLLPTGAS
ncbi:MAG: universal stress protein [Burkholderiaceae bacterium]